MFGGHYVAWRQSRMNGLDKWLGHDFWKGKTVLEVGCGFADIGNTLHDRGAIVSCCDASESHIEHVKEKYPHLNSFVYDMDSPFEQVGTEHCKRYDVVLHFGVLYHLASTNKHMDDICQYCDWLILETEVNDSDGDYVLIRNEGTLYYDQAYNGWASRLSAKHVEIALERNGMEYTRYDDSILNARFHIYDWPEQPVGDWVPGHRRFWICQKM